MDEQEMVDTCTVCEATIDDCQCWECSDCGERKSEDESRCEQCDHCEDCCTCWWCESCDRRQSENDSQCSCCESCERCCSCWYCEGCSESHREDSWNCSNCEQCEDCCECSRCEHCDDRFSSDDFCRDCDRCTSCCACNDAHAFGLEFCHNPLTFHTAKKPEHRDNPSKRHIAVEIEVAALGDGDGQVTRAVDDWSGNIVEDGSLPNSGFEINTAPASGDQFVNQIRDICQALQAQDASVTRACGLHVHIDARDYTYYDLRRLVLLYEKLEPALLSIVAPSRSQSNYCRPCGTRYADAIRAGHLPKETKHQLIHSVYGLDTHGPEQKTMKDQLQGHTGQKYDQARYGALNLHSWFFRGTIECRMHHGTVNPEKITHWGILWAGILDAAMRLTEKQIAALPGTSLDILKTIAPTAAVRTWIDARYARFHR